MKTICNKSRNFCSLQFMVIGVLTLLFSPVEISAQTPDVIHKLAKENPSKSHLVRDVWKKYRRLAEYYAEKQGIVAIEALAIDPVAAVYSMEVFPGYFQKLAKNIGGDAIHFFKATIHHPQLFTDYAKKLPRYVDKPKLLGVLIRSHPHAKQHLITDLEAKSPILASQFVAAFATATPIVRRAIIKTPNASFFLLETGESGIRAMNEFGPVVAEIATFYRAGKRKEVIRDLKIGGKSLIAAYHDSSIIGWRTAARFPALYNRLVKTIGLKETLDFLNVNAHYIASYIEDPTRPQWVDQVAFQVENLNQKGLLRFTQIDSYGFALATEIGGGKQLLERMGRYMPGALLYHYYPRHKVFLSRFLNRYGVAPLNILYDYAKKDQKRKRLEKIIDKFNSKGLLLMTYVHDRDQTMDYLLAKGFNRGEKYLAQYSFDSYGVPSYQGVSSKEIVPDWVKVTVNYFWYGTNPSWLELGIAVLDVIDLIESVVTVGGSKVVNKGGKILIHNITEQVFVNYAKKEAKKYSWKKIKKIAKKIAWKALKKVVRDEIRRHRYNQLEPIGTPARIGARMTSNFVRSTLKLTYSTALAEFLAWSKS